MACKCTNQDGTLSQRCTGACVKEVIATFVDDVKRDPMNGFVELIMSQVEVMIRNRMTTLQVTFQKEQFDTYKKAYIEGIHEGIAIGNRLIRDDY